MGSAKPDDYLTLNDNKWQHVNIIFTTASCNTLNRLIREKLE